VDKESISEALYPVVVKEVYIHIIVYVSVAGHQCQNSLSSVINFLSSSYLDRHGIVPLLCDNLASEDGEHAVIVSKDNIRQGAISHERNLGCRCRVEIVQELVASCRLFFPMAKDLDTERLLNGDCLSLRQVFILD